MALLDTLYLLQAPLDWERILAWSESSPVGAPLHLILGYLSRRGLAAVPDAVAARLARSPHGLGRAPQAILHRLLERYLVEGRPFGRILPLHRFERVWETLLGPGPPAWRLVRAAWSARPSWRGRAQPPAETRLGRSDA